MLSVVFVRKGVKMFWSLEKGMSHGWSMGISKRSDAVAAADDEERAGIGVDVDVDRGADPDLDPDADADEGDANRCERGELAATAAGRFEAAHTANSSSGSGAWVGTGTVDDDDGGGATRGIGMDGVGVVAELPSRPPGASILAGIKPDRMG